MQTVEATVEALTERQKDVLDAALHLLVTGDKALTMGRIAQEASCSKETLYKWFGDRDHFLEAMVQWQAAKVRIMPIKKEALDLGSLFSSLEHFARDWLMVLSSPTSIALNRLAVGSASPDNARLGQIVLSNGPFAMAKRVKPLLELGRDAGLLDIETIDQAFRTFFGLVVRDMQIRLLLGDEIEMNDDIIIKEARNATRHFFHLYVAKEFKTLL